MLGGFITSAPITKLEFNPEDHGQHGSQRLTEEEGPEARMTAAQDLARYGSVRQMTSRVNLDAVVKAAQH